MKKSILALAVASAVTAPVVAQNVSVYGVLDVSTQSINNTAAEVSSSTIDTRGYTCSASAVINRTSVNSNFWASSRLGFKGTEDLGGGLKASFNLEGGAAADLGEVTLASRLANISLSGAFGSITLGKVSSDLNTVQTGHGNFANIAASTGTAQRPNNAIDYATPSFNGFGARVIYSPNAAAAESTKDGYKENEELSSVAINGKIGAFSFVAVQASQTKKSSAQSGKAWVTNSTTSGDGGITLTDSTMYTNGGGTASYALTNGTTTIEQWITLPAEAQDGKVKDSGVLVGYDLGFARLSGQYLRTKTEGSVNNSKGRNATTDLKIYAGTVVAPLAGGITPFVAYRSVEDKTASDKDGTNLAIGVDYALSKRTNAYVVHSAWDVDASSTLGSGVAGSNLSTLAIGVRHTF